jgi:hypothetical protein
VWSFNGVVFVFQLLLWLTHTCCIPVNTSLISTHNPRNCTSCWSNCLKDHNVIIKMRWWQRRWFQRSVETQKVCTIWSTTGTIAWIMSGNQWCVNRNTTCMCQSKQQLKNEHNTIGYYFQDGNTSISKN